MLKNASYWLKCKLYPLVAVLREYKTNYTTDKIPSQSTRESKSYLVQLPATVVAYRPIVLHVIANFCTGGSSRLVVDLIENLGTDYDQRVVTSYIPTPPDYTGLDITEYRFPANEQPFLECFTRVNPAFIHVHYWGDCDEPWYAKAILAAEKLGIAVIENINTPIAPYISPAIRRYVHVSDYVRKEFGQNDSSHLTIYPGSDFSHFNCIENTPAPENCIGMVYRLERDKLNKGSILPFIRTVQKRPNTQVLIVGGGSLLEDFKRAVTEAGVLQNFEFTGYVSYTTLPAYYRRMAVFVAPVWKESFGQVSPFAMNMKIPVCGYDVGAIGEIVGNPALLAPSADADQLAEIIVRLLDAPKERATIGEYQHQRAQANFSVQAMIRAYGEIYQQILPVHR
jgi:glycosyltransferase involved in cell wall biosynthesis